MIPDAVKAHETGGKIPDGFLAGPRSLIGYGVLVLVVVAVLALGRRMPPRRRFVPNFASSALSMRSASANNAETSSARTFSFSLIRA